jgi:hypothetical protein
VTVFSRLGWRDADCAPTLDTSSRLQHERNYSNGTEVPALLCTSDCGGGNVCRCWLRPAIRIVAGAVWLERQTTYRKPSTSFHGAIRMQLGVCHAGPSRKLLTAHHEIERDVRKCEEKACCPKPENSDDPMCTKQPTLRDREDRRPGHDDCPSEDTSCSSQLMLFSQEVPNPPHTHTRAEKISYYSRQWHDHRTRLSASGFPEFRIPLMPPARYQRRK